MKNINVIEQFLAYLKSAKGRSDLTIREYFYDLQTFFRFYLDYIDAFPKEEKEEKLKHPIEYVNEELVTQITKKDIYSFITYMEFTLKNSNRTKSRKLSSLNTFFKYLMEVQDVIEVNPVETVDLPKIERRLPNYLTLEEAKSLLSETLKYKQKPYYRWRDYTIITLLLNCGMRLSELSGMDVNDLLEDNTVRVVGKGNKERIIYLNRACIKSLEEYLPLRQEFNADSPALFFSMRKQRMSNRSIQHMVEKHIINAGLDPEKITVHKLRHTAATLMYQYGEGDLLALQEILGHESVTTTQIYTHINKEQLKKATADNPLAFEDPTEEKE